MEKQVALTNTLKSINKSIKTLENLKFEELARDCKQGCIYAEGLEVGIEELRKLLDEVIEFM